MGFLLRFFGLGLWLLAVGWLIWACGQNPFIAGDRAANLGVTVPALVVGILSMPAAIIIVDWFTPWFDFGDLFTGDGLSKLSGAIIIFGILLVTGLIYMGAN